MTVYQRSKLNPAIRRYIKRIEKETGRKCRKIWSHTNPKGETFLYGSFCINYNRLFVTIGAANIYVSGGFTVPR